MFTCMLLYFSSDDLRSFDNVAKVDPTNRQQLELLYQYFSHNLETIDFWLNFCVFPTETRQFPQHMDCNAWHLADNSSGKLFGFSGTNDNHRLLPLQVRQHVALGEQSLQATNGKMLDVILKNPKYYALKVDVSFVHLRALHKSQQCDLYYILGLSNYEFALVNIY